MSIKKLYLDKDDLVIVKHKGSAWEYKIGVDAQDDLFLQRDIDMDLIPRMKPPTKE